MQGLQGSEIRELLKLTQQPQIISFAGGMPAPELFPVEEMKKYQLQCLKKMEDQLCNILQQKDMNH